MNKLSSLLHQATFAGFLLLICTMIYGFSDFQRMVLYFFFGCTALEFVIDQKWRNYRWTKEKTWYSLVLLFFLLFYLYHLWEGSSTRFSYYSSFRYPLGGFAIAGLTGWNDRFRLRPVMYAFIGGSLLAMVHLLALADYSAVAGKGLLTVWQYSRIDHVNSHMVVNFFLNVSIVFIYAYLSTREGVSKGEKIALWAIGLVLAVCICLSEGRSGLLSLFIMLLLMAVIKIHQFAKKRFYLFLGVLLVPVVLLIFVKPRFQPEVIKEEPRIDLWMTAVEVISERPVFGYGVCRAEDTYRKLLFEKGIVDKYPCFEVVREKGRLLDTHNQYLQTTLDFGVAGLLLLLAIYLLPVFAVRKENRIWVGMLVVLCMFQSAFDMFLTGQFSMLFMSLMTVALHPDITAPLPVAKTDD